MSTLHCNACGPSLRACYREVSGFATNTRATIPHSLHNVTTSSRSGCVDHDSDNWFAIQNFCSVGWVHECFTISEPEDNHESAQAELKASTLCAHTVYGTTSENKYTTEGHRFTDRHHINHDTNQGATCCEVLAAVALPAAAAASVSSAGTSSGSLPSVSAVKKIGPTQQIPD